MHTQDYEKIWDNYSDRFGTTHDTDKTENLGDEWGDLDGKLKNTNARKNHRFTYFHQGAIADAVLAGVRKKLPNLRIFMVSEGNGQPLLLATDKDIAQFLVFNMGELLDYEKTHL